MPKPAETWYDRQANVSKLITYAALLVLLASLIFAADSAYLVFKAGTGDFNKAMFAALAGIATSAFLVGVSAIIDLLIVNAEALRNK